MTISELSCFLSVAQNLSFSKAAKELYISQPAVSKHIHALEKELNTLLINRDVRHSITLTPAGEILFQTLTKCRQDFSAGLSRIADLSAIAPIPTNLTEDIILPDYMMGRFQELFSQSPMVDVQFKFINNGLIAEKIHDGELVICSKEAIPSHLKCNMLTLAQDIPFYLIASRKHPAFSDKGNDTLSNFSNYPFFVPKSVSSRLISFYSNVLEKSLASKPEVSKLNNFDMILLYLHGCKGYTLSTEWFKGFNDSELCSIPLSTKTSFVLIWDEEKLANPSSVHELTNYLK